ncbi:tRNA lysidine(34) synthetase TilS [Bythopirellula polymerisocia]|uniref:tRNA(Ile)-lysidine synthase n=1 Tax=Bythopirellula polymerisocia TaxID=2528003 RepID=A0A5C6CGP0_9BACT|nr:tRNA lysidine(34) synthetase TilS [Bythopirellula polymerisocia]TWU23820.1 tRNA(Ile)-lysidine synthase [Bythopirellula polymerisocia]
MNPTALVQKIGSSWPPATWKDVNIGIALSGGADSVALLRSLEEIKQSNGGSGELFALHVNHHLRGEASDGEQHWCEELCRKLEIPFEALQGDVARRARKEGDGIEAAARHERYALLTQAAERCGIRYLAFAHTQNDQVETILFRLLRGTGIRGIAGMSRVRGLTPTLSLIRPMLSCTRNEILAYLSEREQSFCNDQSNTDSQFVRNRLRNELLPLLRSNYDEKVDRAILRLSEQALEIQSFLEAEARKLLSHSLRGSPADAQNGTTRLKLNIAALANRPEILIREALRIAWRESGLAEQEMNFDWWCKLADLVLSPASNRVLNLPGNVRAQVIENRLHLEWQHS